MFGKRKTPPAGKPGIGPAAPAPPPSGGSGAGGGTQNEPDFPWAGDSAAYVACNLAAGNIANNLQGRLAIEGGVHAETYVAAAGAIAGFAAQRSLPAPREGDVQLQVAATTDGGKYFFGDALNFMLVPRTPDEARSRVWAWAAGGAVSAGLDESRCKYDSMFAHAACTIGTEREGFPSVPKDHGPTCRRASC